MGYVDLHCDTISRILEENGSINDKRFMVNLDGLEKAGADVQFFACFVYGIYFDDKLTDKERRLDNFLIDIHPGAWDKAYEHVLKMSACLDSELSDDLKLARSYDDIVKNMNEGVISAVKTVEEGGVLAGDIKRLDALYNEGVRLITLTWNFRNCIGHPNSTVKELMDLGLTSFGQDVVGRMNELGMIIDVSHLSDGGFYECINLSDKPIVASHSDVRALCPHPRNLTDHMIRTLAEHGGVAGLNLCPEFIREDGQVCVDDLVKHVVYMMNKGGEDIVCLGTDFDGIRNPYRDNWINTVNDMPLLFEALKKYGLSERQLDKFMYGNAMRVMKDNRI